MSDFLKSAASQTAFGRAMQHTYRHILKRDEDFSRALSSRLWLYLQDHPKDGIGGVADLVADHTPLDSSAFDKLDHLDRLPFLNEVAKKLKLFKRAGGAPKSEAVQSRRAKVKRYHDEGLKPGEIAWKLQVDPRVIYSDISRLKD